MENIFVLASRTQLRFDLQGNITTEQLWKVDPNNLINYEEQLTEVVEGYGKSTRRKAGRKTKEQEMNELRLAIVSYVLDIRLKEQEDAKTAAADKLHNQKIMDLIAEKQDDSLKNMSVDELKALLK